MLTPLYRAGLAWRFFTGRCPVLLLMPFQGNEPQYFIAGTIFPLLIQGNESQYFIAETIFPLLIQGNEPQYFIAETIFPLLIGFRKKSFL